jgi:hypothetical protein
VRLRQAVIALFLATLYVLNCGVDPTAAAAPARLTALPARGASLFGSKLMCRPLLVRSAASLSGDLSLSFRVHAGEASG